MLKRADKHPVTTVLNKKENIKYLDLLHSQFVVVPGDKASKNIDIIFKKSVPTGFRYITSGRNTGVNGLSKILHFWKLLKDIVIKYIKFDHIHDYIVTDSNKDILNYVCL